MVGILSMKTKSDDKASILTFLHFSLRKMLLSGACCLHPLSALQRHFRPGGGTTKGVVVGQPARDASAVPFCSRPQATYLIDIANTSALNCLLKHLNEKPFPARMGSYPRELCAACFPSSFTACTKAKVPQRLYPPRHLVPFTVCGVEAWGDGVGGLEIFLRRSRDIWGKITFIFKWKCTVNSCAARPRLLFCGAQK